MEVWVGVSKQEPAAVSSHKNRWESHFLNIQLVSFSNRSIYIIRKVNLLWRVNSPRNQAQASKVAMYIVFPFSLVCRNTTFISMAESLFPANSVDFLSGLFHSNSSNQIQASRLQLTSGHHHRQDSPLMEIVCLKHDKSPPLNLALHLVLDGAYQVCRFTWFRSVLIRFLQATYHVAHNSQSLQRTIDGITSEKLIVIVNPITKTAIKDLRVRD